MTSAGFGETFQGDFADMCTVKFSAGIDWGPCVTLGRCEIVICPHTIKLLWGFGLWAMG